MDRREDFERLFHAHRRAVASYAQRRGGPAVADDVVAETFLAAWRRFDEIPRDALPWLYGVARGVLANQRRAGDRRASLAQRLAAEPARPSIDPGDTVAENELYRVALARLPALYRDALMLVAWEGLDGRRAARAAGCSRAAFEVRLHRARRRLLRELAAVDSTTIQTFNPTPREVRS